jgi:hypothetical protein
MPVGQAVPAAIDGTQTSAGEACPAPLSRNIFHDFRVVSTGASTPSRWQRKGDSGRGLPASGMTLRVMPDTPTKTGGVNPPVEWLALRGLEIYGIRWNENAPATGLKTRASPGTFSKKAG